MSNDTYIYIHTYQTVSSTFIAFFVYTEHHNVFSRFMAYIVACHVVRLCFSIVYCLFYVLHVVVVYYGSLYVFATLCGSMLSHRIRLRIEVHILHICVGSTSYDPAPNPCRAPESITEFVSCTKYIHIYIHLCGFPYFLIVHLCIALTYMYIYIYIWIRSSVIHAFPFLSSSFSLPSCTYLLYSAMPNKAHGSAFLCQPWLCTVRTPRV